MNRAQAPPALFVPHGAPTFALRPGAAGAALVDQAATLPLPRAIVIVSAHWDTAVPTVGFAERLETIHDFWGFPGRVVCHPLPGHWLPGSFPRSGRRPGKAPAFRWPPMPSAASTTAPGCRSA